jgi:hypothetical protein
VDLEQFRNTHKLLRESKGAVFLRKTALCCVASVYTNSETVIALEIEPEEERERPDESLAHFSLFTSR